MKYDLIIFDCDGTLVDTESVTRRVFVETMQSYGLSGDQLSILDDMRGAHMAQITDYMASVLSDFDAEAFVRTYRMRCRELFEQSTMAIPGVRSLLRDLKGHHCIGSNAPHTKMQVTLTNSGLMEHFAPQDIHSAYDIDRWKPDPALYLHILDYYKITADRAVIIEDSRNGAQAGISAAIDVVIYDPHALSELVTLPAPRYHSMDDIYQHFDKRGMISA